MIQSLRQIKLRIRSIEATRRIMRAMEMVSAAKLNRVKGAFYAQRPYLDALEMTLKNAIADTADTSNPLLTKRANIRSIALCVITSDTGLCGNYNNSVLRLANSFIYKNRPVGVKLTVVGREALAYFGGLGFAADSYLGLYGRYTAKIADDISTALVNSYVSGDADEVYVAYTRFSPSLRHKPVVEKILNIDTGTTDAARDALGRYLFEPDGRRLIEAMVPAYLTQKMRAILLDAFAAEHSARMLAMKTATDNATELIDKLTLMRNKARQFAITKEILEIAMSAEALKG
jgi:F-type H+-transporting ATPase subunit gamma